jgi:type II secretory pathway pseudopilin PulG
MTMLRDERGMTLTELVVAVTVMMLVIGSTLAVLETFVKRSHRNNVQNDAQEKARMAVDRLTRQLRNLAKPTTANVLSIDKAGDYDLVFQTVDPQKRRVRYCLDDANSANAVLYMQAQAFPTTAGDPGLPSTSACPAPTSTSGWATSIAVTGNITNTFGPADRNVFYYTGLGADGDTSKITAIRAELFVDADTTRDPTEVSLASGVFLRNQNQRPVASFSITPTVSRTYIFNGADSSDAEGRTLDYFWYRGSGDPANVPDCLANPDATGGGWTCIGRGLTLTYKFPTGLSSQNVVLKVVDPGDLTATESKAVPGL